MRDDPRPELMIAVGNDRDISAQFIVIYDFQRKTNVFVGIFRLILLIDPVGRDPILDHVIVHRLRLADRFIITLTAGHDRYGVGVLV